MRISIVLLLAAMNLTVAAFPARAEPPAGKVGEYLSLLAEGPVGSNGASWSGMTRTVRVVAERRFEILEGSAGLAIRRLGRDWWLVGADECAGGTCHHERWQVL